MAYVGCFEAMGHPGMATLRVSVLGPLQWIEIIYETTEEKVHHHGLI